MYLRDTCARDSTNLADRPRAGRENSLEHGCEDHVATRGTKTQTTVQLLKTASPRETAGGNEEGFHRESVGAQPRLRGPALSIPKCLHVGHLGPPYLATYCLKVPCLSPLVLGYQGAAATGEDFRSTCYCIGSGPLAVPAVEPHWFRAPTTAPFPQSGLAWDLYPTYPGYACRAKSHGTKTA